MSNGGNGDIDYNTAIDAALKEAAANEAGIGTVTELEPDPTVQETPVQEETITPPDIGQYLSGQEEGGEVQDDGQEISDQGIRAPEGSEEATATDEEPLTIEERLDDITEIVQGTQELLKSLIGIMEKQGGSIDSIGARVIEAVQTVMQHSGAKLPPAAPKPAPAVVEEVSETGPSEAEKANLQTITALKERRS